MPDLKNALTSLRRPQLLVRAARHGLADYNRKRDLRRISGTATTKNSVALVEHLVEREEQFEQYRRTGEASYSISRHIEVLVALMAEYRLLPRDMRAS